MANMRGTLVELGACLGLILAMLPLVAGIIGALLISLRWIVRHIKERRL